MDVSAACGPGSPDAVRDAHAERLLGASLSKTEVAHRHRHDPDRRRIQVHPTLACACVASGRRRVGVALQPRWMLVQDIVKLGLPGFMETASLGRVLRMLGHERTPLDT
jgi:hypothetical protein